MVQGGVVYAGIDDSDDFDNDDGVDYGDVYDGMLRMLGMCCR